MPAPKGNKNAIGNRGGKGRQEKYRPEFIQLAEKACMAGFTDRELGQLFGVAENTINAWKNEYVEFADALKVGKTVPDDRVERSLYHRAIGYTFNSEKVFQYQGVVVRAETVEHVPPDTTACIFWLKNRRPADWRDKQFSEVSGPDGKPLVTAIEVSFVVPTRSYDDEDETK